MATNTFAIIDVGTLKTKFEIRSGGSEGEAVLYRDKRLTVLGRDLHKNDNKILETSVKKTIDALLDFKTRMVQYGVEKYKAVATEAIRKAQNSEEVLGAIYESTGIELVVLTHEDEAKIFFLHIAKSFPDKRIAVADIGGGSVQLVVGRDDVVESIHLFKTGTYFMQEELSNSHHPTAAEITKARQYIKNAFQNLANSNIRVDELIYGSSNIIDFMQAMQLPMEASGFGTPHNYRVKIADLEKLFKKITSLSYEDRMPMFPQEPYYMWSADNALLNVFGFMHALKINTTIPTNDNLSSGLLGELHDSSV